MKSEKKHTQDEAAYTPKARRKFCATCEHFRQPKSCQIVEGKISPDGSCKYYEKATAKGKK